MVKAAGKVGKVAGTAAGKAAAVWRGLVEKEAVGKAASDGSTRSTHP